MSLSTRCRRRRHPVHPVLLGIIYIELETTLTDTETVESKKSLFSSIIFPRFKTRSLCLSYQKEERKKLLIFYLVIFLEQKSGSKRPSLQPPPPITN
jgi:hypothetical protein